eukprot:7387319-Pyramimonas_sp.AAC.1
MRTEGGRGRRPPQVGPLKPVCPTEGGCFVSARTMVAVHAQRASTHHAALQQAPIAVSRTLVFCAQARLPHAHQIACIIWKGWRLRSFDLPHGKADVGVHQNWAQKNAIAEWPGPIGCLPPTHRINDLALVNPDRLPANGEGIVPVDQRHPRKMTPISVNCEGAQRPAADRAQDNSDGAQGHANKKTKLKDQP